MNSHVKSCTDENDNSYGEIQNPWPIPRPMPRFEVTEDIVISGIAGRFPESDNMDEFADNLFKNKDMVTSDDRRWPADINEGVVSRGGKLKELDKFDSSFFNTLTIIADAVDPQSRLMLETTYEAICDAGINPQTMRGSNTGVYVGINTVACGDGIPQDDYQDCRKKDALLYIYGTKNSAIESVIDGRSVAALVILQNYSQSFTALYGSENSKTFVVEKAFFENKRSVKLYIDLSKPQGFLMLTKLMNTYLTLIRGYLSHSGQNPEFISIFDDTWIYGNKNMNYGEYLIGSCLSLIIFVIPLLLISNSIIAEKKEGILERSLVAGVQIFDYFFTHLVIRILLLTGKVVLVLIAVYPLIGEIGRNNFVLLSTMVFMQGLSGISFGLLISIVSKDDLTMAMILAGGLLPSLMLSGVIWPIESLSSVMKYIGYVLPMTTKSGAMSSIMNRGWGLDHYEVCIGYVVNIVYTSLYIFIAYVLVKYRILFN